MNTLDKIINNFTRLQDDLYPGTTPWLRHCYIITKSCKLLKSIKFIFSILSQFLIECNTQNIFFRKNQINIILVFSMQLVI